ncbi:MAG: penicillin-binding transpeptidase domain-containing protein [Fibrobacterota bacterium]
MEIRKDSIDGIYLDRLAKSKVLMSIFLLFFIILFSRIAYIQIVRGERYLELSQENRLSREMIHPERGLIYDRAGRIIAQNRPSYSLYITPRIIPRQKDLVTQLSDVVTAEGAPLFHKHMLQEHFRNNPPQKDALSFFNKEPSVGNFKKELKNLKTESGTPLFNESFLDSLFAHSAINEYSLQHALRANSLQFVKKRLLKIRNREGEPLVDPDFLHDRIQTAIQNPRGKTLIAEDISIEFVSIIQENSSLLPGITIGTESRREYPYGKDLFHIIGYISEINSEELTQFSDKGYYRGDKIGKAGIEAQYDSLLKGEKGWAFIERNSIGTNLGILEDMPYIKPKAGKNLFLSVDAELQRMIARQFHDTLQGAVVAMNPQNGEIYALYSNPSFDANTFSLAEEEVKQNWNDAQQDPRKPLMNKTITANYSPGSTFKLITALAGLESESITPTEYMEKPCTGGMRFGNRYYRCWYEPGHGHLTVYDAIKQSCNVYFYQLGLMLGDDVINNYAQLASLGVRTGIDIPGERAGYLSGRIQHNLRHAHRGPGWTWTRGLILNLAIGQAQDLTPLQIAMIPTALSGYDSLYTPRILSEIRSPENAYIRSTEKTTSASLDFDSSSVNAVKEGMWRTVNAPGGTGWRSRHDIIPVGGKTGTAQNPHGENHAIYVGAAPIKNPEIVVSVVLANAGSGGSVAAPFAKTVFDYYFSQTSEGRTTLEKFKDRDSEGWTQ